MADRRNDIEKYLKGEMTPAEQHAFEKDALRDPFLQEALEGAEEINVDEFSKDLDFIQANLKERTAQETKVISFWGWTARIAAGLLLISISVVLVRNLFTQQTPTELALNKTPEPAVAESKPVAPGVKIDSITASENNNSVGEQSKNKKTNPIKARAKEQVAFADEEIVADAQPGQAATVIADVAQEQTEIPRDTNTSTPLADVALATAPMAGAKTMTKETSVSATAKSEIAKKKAMPAAERVAADDMKVIKGKVTTDDGIALPGVNVVVKGTATGTVTDVYGNYQLTVSDPNRSMVFSFIGMEPKEVAVPENQQLDVQLAPDVSALSEVVVVGYAATGDEDEEPKIELAVPEGGRTAYKQYLEKNLHYPELALENQIEGRVTIEFTVDSFGKIGNFKVIKGLGFGCDEEVIRLIQQGPKWIPTKKDSEPVSDNVRVKMRFKTPKK